MFILEIGKFNAEKTVRRKLNDIEFEQTVVSRGACEKQQSSGVPSYECRLREACEALDIESPNSDNIITDRMIFYYRYITDNKLAM